jgi:DNA-binding NarL/FixJ family response regulator
MNDQPLQTKSSKAMPASREGSSRKPTVCLLSTHPLVLPELQRCLSASKFHILSRQLDIAHTSDVHSIPLPVASVYLLDGHSIGPAVEGLVGGIRHRFSKRHIVVLVEQITELYCFPLLRLGVKGLVQYKDVCEQLVPAVRLVAGGGIWVPRALMSRYLEVGQGPRPIRLPSSGAEGLSRREKEVLSFLLKNFSNKEIATTLHISESTVKFHVSNVISRFGVRRRADLILRCLPETSLIQ